MYTYVRVLQLNFVKTNETKNKKQWFFDKFILIFQSALQFEGCRNDIKFVLDQRDLRTY